MRNYISEFIGTFFLILMGCGTAVSANALFSAQGLLPASFGMAIISIAFGIVLIVLTHIFGKISGAHFNPAVSLAMVIAKKLPLKDFLGYIVSQFAGGVAGAALLIVILGGRTSLGANGYGSLSTFGINMWIALLVEIVAAFFFVLAVMSACDKGGEKGSHGLISGLALTAVYFFTIPYTGGSVNPARSLGPALLQGGDALIQVWVFIVAPLAGGLIAALVYRGLFYRAEKKSLETEADAQPQQKAFEQDRKEEIEDEI